MESYMTRQNAQALEGLEPQKVFSYFGEIASIPHGSKNEKQLSDFICRLGREKGWEVFQDEHYNVVLKKEESPGYERVPALLMQAHLDMVCEKVPGVEHDFLRDPLKLYRDGRYLRAKGTTLGADNGIGVALLLAVLDTEGLCHPRLEVLLTADEEAGMSGIRGFDGRIITAEHLLNLDSKMDSLTVACAGGQQFSFRMTLGRRVSREDKTFRIVVDGLRGGHSGAEIDKGRGNAIRLMARILTDLRTVMAAEIVGVEGEGKANVIPRRAQAKVNVSDGQALREFLGRWQDLLSREWRNTDGGVTVQCEEMEYCRQVLTEDAACRGVFCWFQAVRCFTISTPERRSIPIIWVCSPVGQTLQRSPVWREAPSHPCYPATICLRWRLWRKPWAFTVRQARASRAGNMWRILPSERSVKRHISS